MQVNKTSKAFPKIKEHYILPHKHNKCNMALAMQCILTSHFRNWAMCNESSCIGMIVRMPCRQSIVSGTSILFVAKAIVSLSPTLHMSIGSP